MSFDRRKVMKALVGHGFTVLREGGKHTIIRRDDGTQIAVPRGRKLNRYTVRGMATDAGVDWARFQREVS